jgi:hypothetical protein
MKARLATEVRDTIAAQMTSKGDAQAIQQNRI